MAEKITMSDAGVLVLDDLVAPSAEGGTTGVDVRSAARLDLDAAAAADDIVRAFGATISDKIMTYEFARLMEGVATIRCSDRGAAIVERL